MALDFQNRLGAAFDAGRLLNEARWHLMQCGLLGARERQQRGWQRVLVELGGKAFELASDIDTGNRLIDKFDECSKNWQSTFESEDYAEQFDAARKSLNPANAIGHSPTMQAFCDIIDNMIKPMIEGLRTSCKPVLSQSPEIEEATYLGETVDQGLHPNGVEFRLYETAINKAWFVHVRRNPESRHVSLTSVLDTSVETKPKAILPPKLVIVARHRDSGELDPPPTWSTTIKAIWKRLRLTPEFPDSMLHFASQGPPDMRLFRRRVVVKELSRRSKVGLRILADAYTDHLTPDTATLENRAPHSDATKTRQPAGMRMADGVAAIPTLVGGNPITVAQVEDPNSLGESQQPLLSAEPIDARGMETIIAAIGDESAPLILKIIEDKSKPAVQKLYEMTAIDIRFIGWNSPSLGRILGVSSNAIRDTAWWNEYKKKKKKKKLRDDDDDA